MEHRTVAVKRARKMPGWRHTPTCHCVDCDLDRAGVLTAAMAGDPGGVR